VHALHENYAKCRLKGARYKADSRIYEYGAIKSLTNLKTHMAMNLERFMKRSNFALYLGVSHWARWTIIASITNDSKNGQEIEFVDKKTSTKSTNAASVIPAAAQEHRAVLGLVSPAE